MSPELYQLFQSKFEYIRDEHHLKALLIETAKSSPAYIENTAQSMLIVTLQEFLAPVERKRLEQMRKDPAGLNAAELKWRQSLYNFAKVLASRAGYSEERFLEIFHNEVDDETFLGGQWIEFDNNGDAMIMVARELARHSEISDRLLYSST